MDEITKYSTMADPNATNPKELDYYKRLEDYFTNSEGTNVKKLKNFAKYVPRQDLTRFLVRYELFKKIHDLAGSIIECGVLNGAGLMTFAHLSSIFEHLNYQRKIIGFDTFEGFPSDPSEFDNKEYGKKGNLKENSYDDIKKSIELYDLNRFLNNESKVELVKGDINKTVPEFIKENPQTVISLLYVDVDLYEPTKTILENFVPHMPKGAIIAFDDVNDKNWPGETKALLDTIGIRNIKLKRFSFDTRVAYTILDSV